ncbi:MAG: transglutaminase family protein [Rhodoblastus sp.]|nr:MAG: transglutaminase family protein [Rhodoblastus sp.]
MTIYEVRHRTTYDYAFAASTARLAFRVTPLTRASQRLIAHKVDVTPTPRTFRRNVDFFGTPFTVARFDQPHRQLIVEARSRVEVSRRALDPEAPAESWEEAAAEALETRSLDADSPAHFIYSSPLVSLVDEVAEYAQVSFQVGRSALSGAAELARRIRADFQYEPEATDVTTPLAQAFAQRRGVCQDFAHVMISGLRGLGVPARYVSGYIRTIPPEGEQRLEGADASHAWVEVWCGPKTGWVGFDPTNAILAGDDHIEVALGRDFSDVSPIHGVVLGAGEQTLTVAVDVIPLAS